MKPLSILVADDNEDIQKFMQAGLTMAGHTVACASTGEEALRMLRAQPFDLLITDVLMPDGDGLNVIMGLRKINPAVRILVISGGGTYFRAEDCLSFAKGLGAHGALFKPFGQTALLEAISRAMPPDQASAAS